MKNRLHLSSPNIRYVTWFADTLIVVSIAIILLRYNNLHTIAKDNLGLYGLLILNSVANFSLFYAKLYSSWRVTRIGPIVWSVSKVWLFVVAFNTLLILYFNLQIFVLNNWFITWSILSWICLVLVRILAYSYLHRIREKGLNYHTVILIGPKESTERIAKIIHESAWVGIQIRGQFSLSDFKSKFESCGVIEVNEAWICTDSFEEDQLRSVVHILQNNIVRVRILLNVIPLESIAMHVDEVFGFPVLNVETSYISQSTWLLKNIQDKFISFLCLIFLSPLMLLICIGIKFDSPGPIIFRQKRGGWNGTEIEVYKFRTMYADSTGESIFMQATRDDFRVTPFGRLLRKTSLDELPQFVNVLQGNMSIVGPRPHALSHNDMFIHRIPLYLLRQRVKPGITGWAQVNGFRGETDTLLKMEKRIEHDIFYIKNLSIWFDLKIIFLTIIKIFSFKNVY